MTRLSLEESYRRVYISFLKPLLQGFIYELWYRVCSCLSESHSNTNFKWREAIFYSLEAYNLEARVHILLILKKECFFMGFSLFLAVMSS
jgi:hypothetical protein